MDEKSMILEQERQQRARKRKKHKKLKRFLGILLFLLAAGAIWYVVWGRDLLVQQSDIGVEIVAGEGQELIYAQIVSINGNEITYIETQMPVMNTDPAQGRGNGGSNRTEGAGFSEGIEIPEGMGFLEGMEMPEGMGFPEGMEMLEGMSVPEGKDYSYMGSGQQMSMPDGQMPNIGNEQIPDMSGGQRLGRGEAMGRRDEGALSTGTDGEGGTSNISERGNTEGWKPNKQEKEAQNSEAVQEPTETITTYIPVGTEVTTKLGTITTFSRLAAGDYVALITEPDGDEEIIMAVYIIG